MLNWITYGIQNKLASTRIPIKSVLSQLFQVAMQDVLKLIYLCLRINVLGESRTSMVLH